MQLDVVRDEMVDRIAKERTALLTSCLLNDPWEYTYHVARGCLLRKTDGAEGCANIYVDVVQDLGRDSDATSGAIERAHEFFANALEEESEGKDGRAAEEGRGEGEKHTRDGKKSAGKVKGKKVRAKSSKRKQK